MVQKSADSIASSRAARLAGNRQREGVAASEVSTPARPVDRRLARSGASGKHAVVGRGRNGKPLQPTTHPSPSVRLRPLRAVQTASASFRSIP